jgi:hypothetical protein
MKSTTEIAVDAFLDGFTGAGLFGRFRRPGAPTEFVDSRTLAEIRESGEFAEYPISDTTSGSISKRASHLIKAGSER